MKMALLGASGRVGQRITMEALVRGHVVKALIRNPESFPIAHPRLTVARVDIFDPASVAEAITDSDVVVNATGAGGSDPHTFFVNSTKAVIEGVKRAGGSKRLIVVGGAGSLEVAPGVQLVDTPTFSAAARPTSLAQRETLDILRASAIAWTFFSPSEHFAPGRRTGKYRLGTDQLAFCCIPLRVFATQPFDRGKPRREFGKRGRRRKNGTAKEDSTQRLCIKRQADSHSVWYSRKEEVKGKGIS